MDGWCGRLAGAEALSRASGKGGSTLRSHRLRFALKRLAKIFAWVAALYLLAIPILYFLYRHNLGLNWWEILDGNPTVPPEFRTFVIKNGLDFAPKFNVWK